MAWVEPIVNLFEGNIDSALAQSDPLRARREAAERIPLLQTVPSPLPNKAIYPTLTLVEFRTYLESYPVEQGVSLSVTEAPNDETTVTQDFTAEGLSLYPSTNLTMPNLSDRTKIQYHMVSKYDENNLLLSNELNQHDPNSSENIPVATAEYQYRLVTIDASGQALSQPYYLVSETKFSVTNADGKKIIFRRTRFAEDGSPTEDFQASSPDEISLDEPNFYRVINAFVPQKNAPVIAVDSEISEVRAMAKGDFKGIIFVDDITPNIIRIRIHEMPGGTQTKIIILVNEGSGFYPKKLNRNYVFDFPSYEGWEDYRSRERPVLNIFRPDPSDPTKYGDRLVDE